MDTDGNNTTVTTTDSHMLTNLHDTERRDMDGNTASMDTVGNNTTITTEPNHSIGTTDSHMSTNHHTYKLNSQIDCGMVVGGNSTEDQSTGV